MATSELFDHPLANQVMAYQQMQEDLERNHFGRWVIIYESKLVGDDYESYKDAEVATQEMGLDVLACFIRQVGVDTAIFLSYGR
jgi:hypothetical protein